MKTKHNLTKRPAATARNASPSRLKRILVTTDFSEASKQALPYAAAFAERLGAEVALLNVLEPPPRFVGLESMALLQAGDAAVGHALGELDALAKRAFNARARVKTHVRPGQPFRVITKAARDLDADLLVMATHGFTGLKHTFLGSTTERVVRHAPCPVLAVRGIEDNKSRRVGKPVSIQRMVLATDFSKNSLKAFPLAQAVAIGFGSSLTVLHVVEPFHADWHMDTGDLQRERRQQAQEQLRTLVAREFAGPVKAKAELRAGHPVEAITRFARESGADLIVLATLGRTGLRRALIGSVAERVVRHAPCPVLVVR